MSFFLVSERLFCINDVCTLILLNNAATGKTSRTVCILCCCAESDGDYGFKFSKGKVYPTPSSIVQFQWKHLKQAKSLWIERLGRDWLSSCVPISEHQNRSQPHGHLNRVHHSIRSWLFCILILSTHTCSKSFRPSQNLSGTQNQKKFQINLQHWREQFGPTCPLWAQNKNSQTYPQIIIILP